MSIIQIRDGRTGEHLKKIRFEDVEKYHSGEFLMAIAVGYLSMQAGIEALAEGEILDRKDISVLSGHGGPGFRDAIEYVTRAQTRGALTIDVDYPVAQYDPHRAQSYAFVLTLKNGASVEVSLKEEFLPLEFYDLLKKGREGTRTEADELRLDQLKKELCDRALSMPREDLLQVKRLA
ncbi:FmdE family protein [Paenibacillus abyssi]|uniref:Formylmethanofuran dehydrogenase subunit E domain-containing protein n=1 Tax=Paenibacillus abyssi TaxID=1340531 RepID=A0A917CTZ6_9BACL|nr:FmdE family protein [Paenibacillus abyssi]GGF97762.1 hypothetical protein GCM10010916_13750 [Paenibacillus abyssi]